MKYNNHDLLWTCPHCGRKNIEPMHSDPKAHFASMVCECGEEIDGCLCEEGRIIPVDPYSGQRKGGRITAQKLTPEERTKRAKNAARKRWSTSL